MGDTSLDRSAELAHLPPVSPPRNHGNTVAAWTMVIVVIVGAMVTAVGMVVRVEPLVWGGALVIVVGLVLGRVLSVLGFGQPRPEARTTFDRDR